MSSSAPARKASYVHKNIWVIRAKCSLAHKRVHHTLREHWNQLLPEQVEPMPSAGPSRP